VKPQRSNPRRDFVDTSAYFALINANEIDHPRAIVIATRLAHERRRLFTNSFNLAET